MISRRNALVIVAALIGRRQVQAQQPTAQRETCGPSHPEVLTLDLGAGACAVQAIHVVHGAYGARIDAHELMVALGGKVGG